VDWSSDVHLDRNLFPSNRDELFFSICFCPASHTHTLSNFTGDLFFFAKYPEFFLEGNWAQIVANTLQCYMAR
jgi:hypothetical protein